jgi:hypothetical protein
MVSSFGVSYHNVLKTGIVCVFNWKIWGGDRRRIAICWSDHYSSALPFHRKTYTDSLFEMLRYNEYKVMEITANTSLPFNLTL